MIILEYGGKKPQIGKNVFIAPGAAIIGDVIVEDEASIWFGAVIRGDFGRIRIGRGSSIQDNAVIHVMPDCETVIGENVTVAHSAVLHGCRIGRGATHRDAGRGAGFLRDRRGGHDRRRQRGHRPHGHPAPPPGRGGAS